MMHKKILHSPTFSPTIERLMGSLLMAIEDNLSRSQLVPLSVVVLGIIARLFKHLKQISNASSLAEDIGDPVRTKEVLILSMESRPSTNKDEDQRATSWTHSESEHSGIDEIDQIFSRLDGR